VRNQNLAWLCEEVLDFAPAQGLDMPGTLYSAAVETTQTKKGFLLVFKMVLAKQATYDLP